MLSIPHLIIIFVVALVVFGPEKLPELARTLGRVMSEFRRATGDIRSTFEDHLRDLEREADVRRIGGGSNPPPPRETQADVPAPAEGTVPTSAPNSSERKVSSAHAPPDFESASHTSEGTEPHGSSNDPNDKGSEAHNASETTDGHSAA